MAGTRGRLLSLITFSVIAAVLVAGYGLFGRDEPGDQARSPLSNYVGLGQLDVNYRPDSPTLIATAAAEREQLIAECMSEAGFDYQPLTIATGDRDGPDPATREYAETYGFGITTQAFSQTQVGQHLVGYPDPPGPTPNQVFRLRHRL